MQNKLLTFARKQDLIRPGDRIVCALSGGADSVALLSVLLELRETLNISVEAAHFHHNLRGEEADRDAAFCRTLCALLNIPCHFGKADPAAYGCGDSIELTARDLRYAFLRSLPVDKIATAHTADDNAETVLMHLVRGTGLKGLGGIAEVNGRLIRPMLHITRRQVEDFLQEYHISHIEDSSNAGDDFLRNRIRHYVMPLLQAENPRLAENVSAMAQRLRSRPITSIR